MDSLADFVDQLNAEATGAVPPPKGFPILRNFYDNSTGALKWKKPASGYDIPGQISTHSTGQRLSCPYKPPTGSDTMPEHVAC